MLAGRARRTSSFPAASAAEAQAASAGRSLVEAAVAAAVELEAAAWVEPVAPLAAPLPERQHAAPVVVAERQRD